MLAGATKAQADFDLEKAVMKNLKWIRPPTPGTDFNDMTDFFNTNPKEIDNRQIEAAKFNAALDKKKAASEKKSKKERKGKRTKRDAGKKEKLKQKESLATNAFESDR